MIQRKHSTGAVVSGAMLTAVFAALTPVPARAAADAPPRALPPVRIAAVRARSVVVVDGVLDEPSWSTPPATAFTQRDPNEGARPTESTAVRILYDDSALYIGVRAFDRDAGKIGRRLSRRDDEPDADAVQVYLDPRHDGRSGAMFEVTAAGVQRDALIFNDSSLDVSWDAVWDSAVRIDERGWTAEIRIPLSQLRFPSGGASAWGINIARYIRRSNETDWLLLVPKRETHLAARMAELTGVDGIRPPPRLEAVSHVVARDVSAAANTSPASGALVGALGVDAKAGLGSDLTVDAAVNPDFAQVEGDPAVVNLTAFETFLEERRPFFTESAPLFQTFGNAGGAFDAPAPLLFYSRRIGQAPPESAGVAPLDQPAATPVIGAVKLGGGIGRHLKIAVVDAVSGASTAPSTLASASKPVQTAPLTNYAAGRLLHTTDRGGVGVLATAVTRSLSDASTPGAFVPDRAVVGGADGYVFFDRAQDWVAGGQISASHLAWTPVVASPGGKTAAALKETFFSEITDHAIGWRVATPPATVPGKGPPPSPPGKGKTKTPGGSLSSAPGGGPPATAPGAAVSVADNTGRNRPLDLSLGRLNGWSANANLHRNSGAVRVNLDGWTVSPGFEINDLGYLPRSDIQGLQGQVSWNKFDPDRVTRFRTIGVTKGWTRTFAGEKQSDTIDVWASATFLNYWSASGGTSVWRQAFDAVVTRGGPSVLTPAGRSWWASAGSDARSPISFDAGAYYAWNDAGGWSSTGWGSVTLKPAPNVSVSIGPSVDRGTSYAQYVATIAGSASAAPSHYVFATLDSNDVALTTRVNIIASARLSFQVYAQPFVARGLYTGFKELASPASDRFLRYGVDSGSIRYDPRTDRYFVQTSAASFDFANPDFRPALLDLHAVVRWEWRRGSTLYLVWTQQRSGSAAGSTGVPDVTRALDGPADNAVAAKFTYWFGR